MNNQLLFTDDVIIASQSKMSDSEKLILVQNEINKGLVGIEFARPFNKTLIDEIKQNARKKYVK
jgi:hypothetical protein